MKKQDESTQASTRYVEPRRLLDIRQVSERVGLSVSTIKNGLTRGAKHPFEIRPKRWGKKLLWDSKDVEEFIEGLEYAYGDLATVNTESSGGKETH